MAWKPEGLLVMMACCLVMGQLDIEGHKELLEQQDQDKKDITSEPVKSQKHFQVYDAVTTVVKENITDDDMNNILFVPALTARNEPNVTNEMVSYSTKFSVSLKNNDDEGRIDRNSYHYPSYPVGKAQSPGYIQFPTINENLTPQVFQQPRTYYQPQQFLDPYSQQTPYPSFQYQSRPYQPAQFQSAQYQPDQYQPAQYQPAQYQPDRYQPGQYQPDQYQSYQPPRAEYRQSLPYGELYPSQEHLIAPPTQEYLGTSLSAPHNQEYLTAPLTTSPTKEYLTAPLLYDDSELANSADEVTAKSEQKLGEQAEKRGLGLAFKGGHLGLPPPAGGFGRPLGPIGVYGAGSLLRPGIHHPLPHRVPVPVPVHVPVVRTFHTKHYNNHDHVHKHKNTHSHKGRQNQY